MKLNDTNTVAGLVTQLLAAVPAARRPLVRTLLTDPRCGGRGLRAWLARMEIDDRPVPAHLPGEVVEVYLRDDDAEPLHDCEKCGLAVPVRAGRRCGHEAAVEREYFPTCPHCGGRTGRYAYWSRRTAPATN
jgi:hypothetical protein